MNRKVKLLMSKKELELVQSGSAANVKFHSSARLKDYIALTRKLRDKYRDLTQRQKVARRFSPDTRTIEKAEVFDTLLKRYRKQYRESIGVDDGVR